VAASIALSIPLVNGSTWGQVEGELELATGRVPEVAPDGKFVFSIMSGSESEEQPAANVSKARVAAPWSRRQSLGIMRSRGVIHLHESFPLLKIEAYNL
jgi:hypothetical protein